MYVDCAVHNVRRRYAESGGDAEGRRKARSEIPAKKTYDISGKEAIQASLFPLAHDCVPGNCSSTKQVIRQATLSYLQTPHELSTTGAATTLR